MKLERNLMYAIFALIISCGITLVGLLGYQYSVLRNELDELIALKAEYQSYVVSLKQLNLEVEQEVSETTLQKKKSLDRPFIVVNRDPEHLRRHALTLAQQHNLTSAIQRLYAPRSSAPRTTRAQRSSVRKQKKRGRRMQRTPARYNPEYAQAFPIIWPIAKGDFWISTGFGPRRHPKGHWEFHQGIDMASPRGTPVIAAASGVVVQAQFAGGYGNTVLIAHDHQHKTRYAHLSKILVSVGDYVAQGDMVGTVGSTGNVRGRNGVHLHFEVVVCDKRVNPLYFLP